MTPIFPTLVRQVGTSAFSKLLVGGLALAALASAPIASAAPGDPGPIAIDNFAFAPAELTAPVGSSITWTNAQPGVRHTASSVDGVWDSGILASNATFTFTFDQPGDFAYECLIHPSMQGLVHIVAPAAPANEIAESVDPVESTDAAPSPPEPIAATVEAVTSAVNSAEVPPVSTATPVAPTATPLPTLAPTPTPRVAPASTYPKPTPTVGYGY